jgi:hypothetical protein
MFYQLEDLAKFGYRAHAKVKFLVTLYILATCWNQGSIFSVL